MGSAPRLITDMSHLGRSSLIALLYPCCDYFAIEGYRRGFGRLLEPPAQIPSRPAGRISGRPSAFPPSGPTTSSPRRPRTRGPARCSRCFARTGASSRRSARSTSDCGCRLHPGTAPAPGSRSSSTSAFPVHSYGPTWHFSEAVPPAARPAAIRRFERAAARLLGWGLTGVVYRMVTEPELPAVARRGAVVRESPGGTVLPIRWAVGRWLARLARQEPQVHPAQAAPKDQRGRRPDRHDGRQPDRPQPREMAELSRRHTARLAARLDPRPPSPPHTSPACCGART